MGILPCREIFERPVYPTFVLPSRRDVLMLLPISILQQDEKYFNALVEGRNDPFVLLCYAPAESLPRVLSCAERCGRDSRLLSSQAHHLRHDCRDAEEPGQHSPTALRARHEIYFYGCRSYAATGKRGN